MNYKELQQIAKEVGAVIDVLMLGRHDNTVFTTWELERFAAIIENIVEKRTIERCAVVAEELRHPDGFSGENVDWCAGTDHAAAAIRKLGEQ